MIHFADELRAFQERTHDPGFDALILLGTRQAVTAALLVGTLKLKRVAFLLTDETQNLPQNVASLLGLSPDNWLCPAGDHSTTLAVYQGLRRILDQWSDLQCSKIAVDVTGGLKPMSVGIEKAAHVLGLQTIYVQSEYQQLPDGRSAPIPATQWLVVPPDPYHVFGDLKAAEAQSAFRKYQYAMAEKLFTELATQVHAAYQPPYKAAAALSAAYAAWDVLDFETAGQHLDVLLAFPAADSGNIAPYRVALTQQRTAVEQLRIVTKSVVQRNDDALHTLADPEAVLPLLGTLYMNALRRASQQRYDIAALFQYRCLELISQHRLASHGILSSAPDFDHLSLPKAQLSQRFQDVQRSIQRKTIQGLAKKRSIALFDGYMLLAALDDSLLDAYNILEIEQRSTARNQSVLAHGYRLILETEYNAFAAVVNELLTRLFLVLGRSRTDWESTYCFVVPFSEARA